MTSLYIILPHHRYILGDCDIVPATRPNLRPARVLKSSAGTPRARLLQVFTSVVKLSFRIEVILYLFPDAAVNSTTTSAVASWSARRRRAEV